MRCDFNSNSNPIDWKNVNNWHWVEKNCFPWAKSHVTDLMVGSQATRNGTTVSITDLSSMTGDADINQRKGKLITVFDVAFTISWKGIYVVHFHF
jgi:activator of HSP90 ATPase